MRVLTIGDIHVEEPAIEEIEEIFNKDIFPIDADYVIQEGDLFEKNKPTPKELKFTTRLIYDLKQKYKKVIIMAGNGRHEWLNGEKVISYLQYLGVDIQGMSFEKTIDNKKCYFGHYMTNKSIAAHGNFEKTINELKGYDIVLLAHQHSFQVLVENKVFHIGNIRFTDFGDEKDLKKRVAIIENGELTFKTLEHYIPMKDITDLTELDKLNPKTKIRLIFKDYETFLNATNRFDEWKTKFYDFGVPVLDFEITKDKTKKKELKNETIIESIKKIENKEVRELILRQVEDGTH